MKRLAFFLSVTLLAIAVGINASFQQARTEVVIAQLSAKNWNDLAPEGKEVDAIFGDIVLRNRHLTAVIAKPVPTRHANLTVKNIAGCLIDLTTNRDQSDQLGAFFPGARRYPYRSIAVRDSDQSTVDVSKKAYTSSKSGSVAVRSKGNEQIPAVEVVYSLAADEPFVSVMSKFVNESSKPMVVQLEDDMRVDIGKEDAVRAESGTMKGFWVHDRHWGQAYGVDAPGFDCVVNSSTKTQTIRYESADINRKVTLEPGGTFSITRRIYPGSHLPDVRAIAARTTNQLTNNIALQIKGANKQPIPQARVALYKANELWGTMDCNEEGIVRTELPIGKYEVEVSSLGIDLLSKRLGLEVLAGDSKSTFQIACDRWKPGRVVAKVTDGTNPIPFKIEFLAKNETKQFSWGPDTGDFGIRGLRYCPHGKLDVEIPPGEYEVFIAHGPEHNAVFKDIVVKPGQELRLDSTLKRVVNTEGWISADFHSHSSPSGDNTGSQLGRVLNLVCDHVEFAPCTEHQRVDTYQPLIDELKIGRFIATTSGMELTGQPLLLNHQNAFPLVHRRGMQDGGGPVIDTDVEKQVERISLWDNRSEKLVQINHPDFGWLFRDRNGDQVADEGHSRVIPHIDVIEIHPCPDILTLSPNITASNYKGNNRVFNWLQFMNQGYRFVGVVNSDAHYNYHESGWVRNWIKSPTDDPSKIKPLDVVRASEEGALIMSNGPFLSVSMSESGQKSSVGPGQDLEAKSGRIAIKTKVQCPNWIGLDRVFVLVNGRIHPDFHFRKKTHPNMFYDGRVVRFDAEFQLKLKEDSHVIVVAGCEEEPLGKIHGPTWGKHHPAAFHNPVFVDIDGNGFKPNRDTLGQPLPVKFPK